MAVFFQVFAVAVAIQVLRYTLILRVSQLVDLEMAQFNPDLFQGGIDIFAAFHFLPFYGDEY